jgi:hypothetical protein
MKTLLIAFVALFSASTSIAGPRLILGEYLGNYRTNPKQLCMVSIRAPYGIKTLNIHSSNTFQSVYFELELRHLKKVAPQSYKGLDPIAGELLSFTYKINKQNKLTEAAVENKAIRSNSIDCVNLIEQFE